MTIIRLLAAAALALTLSGCVDLALDVDLTSTETGRATLTQTVSAEARARYFSGETVEGMQFGQFCSSGEMEIQADGGATCTFVEEGVFADLDLGPEDGGTRFIPVGTDQVRIEVPTAQLLASEVGDNETRAVLMTHFIGRTFTLTLSGAEVTETNMTLADDGRSASTAIPITDLLTPSADLPETFFAVVRAP